MRKVMTFVAALCCAMICSTSTVKAALADNVILKVGSITVDETNKDDILGDASTSVVYDDAAHLLMLDNVENLDAIEIDATALTTDPITIQVFGKCSIRPSGKDGIWLKAGKGLVIKGDKNAELTIETGGSAEVSAILCAKDHSTSTESDFYLFQLEGGMMLVLNNKNSSSSTAALVCHHYVFDESNYAFTSDFGQDPIVTRTTTATDNEHNNVQQFSAETNNVKGYAYTEFYPVYVLGTQMSDGKPTVGPNEFSGITGGEISYDKESRTLTLNAVDMSPQASEAIWVEGDSEADKAIKIVVKENCNIITTSAAIKGLFIEHKAELDLQGVLTIDVTGNALEFTKALSIYSSNSNGILDVESSANKGIVGAGSNLLTIDAVAVNAKGDKESFSDFTFLPVDVAMSDPYKWDATLASASKDGTNKAKGVKIEIVQTKWNLSAEAYPVSGGTVKLEYKENASDAFAEVISPAKHEGKGFVQLTATANADYKFAWWYNVTPEKRTDNPCTMDDPSEELGKSNYNYLAIFSRTAKADAEKVYVVDKNVLIKYSANFRNDLVDTVAKIALETNEEVHAAAYHDGKLYYAVYNNVDLKSGIFVRDFDVEHGTLGDKSAVLAMQSDHTPIYTLSYNPADNCLYATTITTSSKPFWKIPTNGDAPTEVVDQAGILDGATPAATAFNKSNELYMVVGTASSKPAYLCTVDVSNGIMTKVGDLTGDAKYCGYDCAMMFDPKTDELILNAGILADKMVFLVDPASGKAEWISNNQTYAHGMFSPVPPGPTHSLTVNIKAGQESRGTVSPAGTTTQPEGDVTITASPKAGWLFDKWVQDNNTNASRTINLTQDTTFTASFKEDPNLKMYPVWIAGTQLSSSQPTLAAGVDLPGVLTAGSILYDDATKTLTLNSVELTVTETGVDAIRFDNGETKGSAITIIIKGDCKIKANGPALFFRSFASATLKAGDETAKLTLDGAHGLEINCDNVIIEGLATEIKGRVTSDGNGTLTIKGSNVVIKGDNSSPTVENVKAVKYELSEVKTSAILDDNVIQIVDHNVSDGTNDWKKDIEFKSWPKLTVKPVEEGTGHFKLTSVDNSKRTYTDVGWFENGEEVKIEAEAEKGFEFGHWSKTTDSNWDNPEDRMGAKGRDNFTMTSADKVLDAEALFYYKSASTVTWFGVNNNKYVSFSLKKHGEDVAKADGTNADATKVKVGDYVDTKWYVLDNTTMQTFDNFKKIVDGDDMSEPKELYTGMTEAVTDMTFDWNSNSIYAVAGNKLYQLNKSDGIFEELGKFKYNTADITVTAIAADAKKKLHVLAVGTPGALYEVNKIDKENDTIGLKPVGDVEKKGSIGMPVVAGEQSLAYEPETNEFYWGNSDYVRVLDMKNNKTYIVADVDIKGGTQGYIKSLHRMARRYTVEAKVANGQSAWGKAYIGDDPSETDKKFLVGTNATVTAAANSGYHFEYWTEEDDSEKINVTPYEFKVKKGITMVAYFAEGEGIELITLDLNTGVQKVIMNGQLYIIHDNMMYDVTGKRVK